MAEKVLVSDAISEDGLKALRDGGFEVDFQPEISQDGIKAIIHEYAGWVIRSRSRATADIIECGAKLRVIGRAGVGVDNVDTEAATKRGVVVMNTPGGNTISTAEHTIAMMMALSRKLPQAAASMRTGKWDRKSYMGMELNGKTLCVFGLGRIGQEVVRRMRAFGMHVLGFDPFVSQERMKAIGVEPADVDDMCRRGDILTFHTPLSPQTANLLNAERLKLLKKTALVINCARGGIVDELALAETLKEKRIGGAAFDVFGEEPLPTEHPLRGLDNCILTPHIAASTVEAQENVAIEVAHQLADYLRRGIIRNAVNAPNIDGELLERLRGFLTLCEKLGSFAAQFAAAPATRLSVTLAGTIAEEPSGPFVTAVAKGFLSALTDEPVNYVNALATLRARGTEIFESSRADSAQFSNLIVLELALEGGKSLRLAGSLVTPHRPRIVEVDNKLFDAVPTGHLVVIENRDVPGIIGIVGTVFGRHGVNIAQMTWGRTERDTTAMTVINVDSRVSKDALAEIRGEPNILSVKTIDLT